MRPGCLSDPAGRHIIFYRHADKGIEVIRILHSSMDTQRHIAKEK
ncbi:type II toxin-antitoxin system RelE/ParE family toxin [Leptolyngbya sp. NK1-12]|uniref:Type II toxin-antitoxin system RelE/ParE family toxin n=1 Tax=Leptolyngbya sp. NK1-12 TaxID=2547451 RepID=A0AA96WPA1_9CYAN|nr:type II toxin-antitoxin system RelE/ParE family toxin [Leptolyngbya sp. NK1-12]